MGKIGHLSTANLVRVLDQLVTIPRWRAAMGRIGASEQLAFVWRAASVKAMADKDTSSIFFVEFRGTWDYWHAHAGRARTENIITYEAHIRDQALNGIEHVVLGPDQRPVYRDNPRYIGRPDDYVMLSTGCEPGEVARYRLELDAKGNPVPLTKVEQIPDGSVPRVLEQDRRYIEQEQIDQQVRMTTAKPFVRLPGEERPDAARLRHASMTPEQRRAEIGASAVPLNANVIARCCRPACRPVATIIYLCSKSRRHTPRHENRRKRSNTRRTRRARHMPGRRNALIPASAPDAGTSQVVGKKMC